MNTLLDQQLPGDVMRDIAERMVCRRKEKGFTQAQLAEKSGVSLGSLRRFERSHQISLASLVKISFALGCEDDFAALFARKGYASIEEVVREGRGGVPRR